MALISLFTSKEGETLEMLESILIFSEENNESVFIILILLELIDELLEISGKSIFHFETSG